jgi:NAD(P)-dependent dehydrogenase (short-subunit alcohol dehydrogenase family)
MAEIAVQARPNDDLFDLTSRRALVTGASRGIERAIAVGLAERGATVIGVARSGSGLEETQRLIEGRGDFRARTADLSDPREVDAVVDAAVESAGGLDILVNNAAADHVAPFEETDLEAWRHLLELNLQSCFLLARSASPHLREGGGGKVINVASILGLVALRNESTYTAVKHGVVGLTRALALEWAGHNVQVNALALGYVETAMLTDHLHDEAVGSWVRRNTPMGRWAQPEEMVGAAVFLASRASDFVTGHVLAADGGWTVQ